MRRSSTGRALLGLGLSLQLASAGCQAGRGPQIHADPVPPESTLRILAYNIRHGLGMDDSVDLARAARVIASLDPDLVALQEIDSATERTGYVAQAKALGDLTGMESVFGGFMHYRGGKYGMAILSRLPIKEHQNYELPGGTEPRSALAALVHDSTKGLEIVFVGIHLYRTEEERLAQAQTLVDLLEDVTAPVILAGDFNSTPGSEVMNLLQQYWYIPGKGGDHFTFPSVGADREIDFIMFRPRAAFEIVESRVIEEPLASDHRPVLLTLRMNTNDEEDNNPASSTESSSER
jgi:endonuclease/exonuclease/phosphatase family metal-dependent hydrolase